ncbi:MAG: argininosuccinate synthase [Planctomycetota bacterium]|nr:argininosuccinate synthase [Planctomycetota bacterium]MDI6787703.1 argininosuccinate synthase [Planctomycetota bacterium]
MSKDTIVLAYSGGLDTSIAIRWLQEKYDADVITVLIDIGQGGEMEKNRAKAEEIGAVKSILIDAKEEFVEKFILPALKANAVYEDNYLLATALGRPLIAQLLVKVAAQENATAVAHGCTGKGNDQVRFDVSLKVLNPKLKIIAPAREWGLTRLSAIEYAKLHNIPLDGIIKTKTYSIDENLWGRSIECGVLEDAWFEPPEDAFELTAAPSAAPDIPTYVTIGFKKGIAVSLDGQQMEPLTLINSLQGIAGANSVGRVDHIENRLVGIKSKEVYECPAATVLHKAHQAMESMTLIRDLSHFKKIIEQKYAELVYYGLWFSPLRESLDAFIEVTQQTATGSVRVKLYKGNCTVVGRQSPFSLYDHKLATYETGDTFNHKAAEGFIHLWGLDLQTYGRVIRKALHPSHKAVVASEINCPLGV